MKDVFIAGTAIHIPEGRRDGHVVADGDTGDMAIAAARRLLAEFPEQIKNEISHVVVACVGLVGDVFDNIATRVQFELGLSHQVTALQLNGGCAVAMNALEVASSLLQSSESKYTLMITSDYISRFLTEKTYLERPSSCRWGDGAAAVLLSNKPDRQKIKLGKFYSQTDGSTWKQFRLVNQNGNLEFKFEEAPEGFREYDLQMATKTIQSCLERNKIEMSELAGMILLNRSNGFGGRLRNSMGSQDLVLMDSFDSIGHLGGTDLLVNLDSLIQSKTKTPGRYLVYSCGYGYTWNAGVVEALP